MKTELQQSEENMSAFLDNLSDIRKSEQAAQAFKRSRTYKWNAIKDKSAEGAHNAAEKVFLTIYQNSLPLDESHKAIFESSIRSNIMHHITESGASNVYEYLKKAAAKGSLPAKTICESAEKYINDVCAAYYQEEDIDPDEIDMSPESETVTDAVTKITSDMSADEVSAAIENNVRATIAKEMEISKQEDQKLAELEEQLTNSDTIKEEADIEAAMYAAGFGTKHIYSPQLFTSIMMGKVKAYTEEADLDGKDIQKKAFYESVKELTALQTLHTLGCIDINVNNVNRIASQYMM